MTNRIWTIGKLVRQIGGDIKALKSRVTEILKKRKKA